ncbi:DinB family protein [Paraburkholderia phytofirmans]|uniref:DinB family protein n=1 Tax=Paraburkholderia phytofirmans TaxID=261302 RepID=UPI0038BA443E
MIPSDDPPRVNPLSSHLAAMARNNAWSNLRLYRACLTLTDEAFAERRVSFFPSLQLTWNHILLVDRYYFDALIGGGAGLTIFDNELPYPRAADLWDAQARSDQQLLAFCESLTDDDLPREVQIDRGPSVGVQREQIGSVLPHVFVHQIHHRGQVHAMLSGTEAAPPQLDEFFLAADAPLRVAELNDLDAMREPQTTPRPAQFP